MTINKKLTILFCLIVLLLPTVLLAGTAGSPTAGSPPPVSLTNPLGTESPQILIGRIINGVLGIVGSIALVMFIYGGFTWMTSSGNMEKVTKGKNILVWAAIGLVVIFASYALVNFVIFEAIQPS